MQLLQAPRASAILYSLLIGGQEKRPWLLPANICAIVPITFLKAGVPFRFVDISPRTLHMDLDRAQALLRKDRFGGLLYAHTYGEASTPHDFFATVKEQAPDLLVLDDRCLCIPDLEPDPANPADVQLYSTGYAKVVELSFGGYAFAREDLRFRSPDLPFRPEQYEELEAEYKRAIARRDRFIYRDSDWLDTRSPVPRWEAYREQISVDLAQSLEQRALLNGIYAGRLPAEIRLPAGFQTWRFHIRVPGRQRILEKIFSAGLFASSHYASLADIMGEQRAPCAEELAESVINLFNDRHFTPDQAEQVCKIILENLA